MFLLILQNVHVLGSKVPEASVFCSLFCGSIFSNLPSLNLVASEVSSRSNQYEPTFCVIMVVIKSPMLAVKCIIIKLAFTV